MARTAMARLGHEHASGADRYLVHVLTDPSTGRSETIDGTPIHPDDAARLFCDCSTVAHNVTYEGEELNLGRRTRDWNTAQRRAIAIRDAHRCRFPGCHNTIIDIHHLHWWSLGGPTDIDNGLSLCARHHTLVHRGFTAAGDPTTGRANGPVTFRRPDGTTIAATSPAIRRLKA
jgi:hypothetical protein